MKKHRIITALSGFLLFLSLESNCIAQKAPVFKITSFRYDFGVILNTKGTISHSFPVENPGGDTLRVLKIKSSAENISGEFFPAKIGPGKKGEIILTYDPSKDKGKVEKFVSVRTNDPQNPIRQFGVLADVKIDSSVISRYPAAIGNLRMNKRHLVMDKLLNTSSRTDTFKIFNAWDKPMSLKISGAPEHISCKIEPALLNPRTVGLIVVTYDAKKSGIFGPELEYLKVETNDSVESQKMISIGVGIIEDFSYLKGNPDKRAKIHFDNIQHDFGELKAGNVVTYSYVFENYGKGELIIRRVKAGCGCTIAELEKKVIKPGEKSSITVKFDTRGMSGNTTKSVTVVSNDPDNPITMLTFSANIIQ